MRKGFESIERLRELYLGFMVRSKNETRSICGLLGVFLSMMVRVILLETV